ncbi:unnamed protein product [Prorocentrum cordatum]|uniref:Diphosphate--fructose-6-phosphate 1-phosphotransferase n=1 Tax=Prorocentrum cordatum TaxID=2364126 RepID=A0ABN9WJH3_9DINO|nr:unnamed protein product [Polarella glacialis]
MAAPKVTIHPQRIRGSASELERQLRQVTPQLPTALAGTWLATDTAPVPADAKFVDTIKGLFPKTCDVPQCTLGSGAPVTGKDLKVGVVLSGGQAPGGHNVVAGIYDAVRRTGPNSECYGFLDGPHGIFSGNVTKFDDLMIDGYRNTGGFDMIGRIRAPQDRDAGAV